MDTHRDIRERYAYVMQYLQSAQQRSVTDILCGRENLTSSVAGYSADMVSSDHYSTIDGGFFRQRTNSKGINV